MNIAVIPARGGSKRIPRKNIREFAGKPMIARSIEAAKESGCFNRIIVSTDDSNIKELAEYYGAEVPFDRPEELSGDFVGTLPVIAHAVQWLAEQGDPCNYICCIYATAPFLSPADLMTGYQELLNSSASYAISVSDFGFPIQRAVRIDEKDRLEMFDPDMFHVRSQDLEKAWHDAAQFYWGKASAWLEQRPLFSADAVAVRIPRYRVQDIDTPEDWDFAELMFEALKSRGS